MPFETLQEKSRRLARAPQILTPYVQATYDKNSQTGGYLMRKIPL